MIWQDMIFLAGSVFSLFVLTPTLKNSMANIPLGTSLPSATIGIVYATTFFTLGMTVSAVGSLVTGLMWSAIALIRSPNPLRHRLDLDASEPRATPGAPAPDAD